jgi:hypothetical protein
MSISLVVTVKAYPAISQKHGEAVCVAGIRTDSEPRWVRLWPVYFRDLPFSQRFQKYQEIHLDVQRSSDTRPESVRPLTDTLVTGKTIGAANAWARRRRLVEPLVVESMCEVSERQQRDKTSLGIFRPGEVQDLIIESDAADWDPKHRAVIAQPSLFAPQKKGLTKVPYRFKFRYRCTTAGCGGHEQSIVDWEIAQAFLGWTQFPVDERLKRIRDRWLGDLCGPARDTHFYVGNQHQHPGSFLILGVFWPPKPSESKVAEVKQEQLQIDLA